MPIIHRLAIKPIILQHQGGQSTHGLDGDILKDTMLHVMQKVFMQWIEKETVERVQESSSVGSSDFRALGFVVVAEICEEEDEE
jgi:hypothetical protein